MKLINLVKFIIMYSVVNMCAYAAFIDDKDCHTYDLSDEYNSEDDQICEAMIKQVRLVENILIVQRTFVLQADGLFISSDQGIPYLNTEYNIELLFSRFRENNEWVNIVDIELTPKNPTRFYKCIEEGALAHDIVVTRCRGFFQCIAKANDNLDVTVYIDELFAQSTDGNWHELPAERNLCGEGLKVNFSLKRFLGKQISGLVVLRSEPIDLVFVPKPLASVESTR